MRKFWRRWLLLLLITMGGIAILVVAYRTEAPQKSCVPSDNLILLSDAQQQMQAYLTDAEINASVQIREEGAFMLGAYPRSQVLWSISLAEQDIRDDTQLKSIALHAYCLREGWVWFTIHFANGATTLQSFPAEALKILSG